MKTIDDMQNEMDFYDHYKMFVYNHDFESILKIEINSFTIISDIVITFFFKLYDYDT